MRQLGTWWNANDRSSATPIQHHHQRHPRIMVQQSIYPLAALGAGRLPQVYPLAALGAGRLPQVYPLAVLGAVFAAGLSPRCARGWLFLALGSELREDFVVDQARWDLSF
jgi:hypothetical protein